MNYTGLGRFNRYKTDRPLMDQEREDRLDRGKRSGFEPQDALTTIRVNSTYLEMVDRWYAQKGIAVWLGLLGVIPIAIWIMAMVAGIYRRGEIGGWIFMAFMLLLTVPLLLGFLYGFRLEAFRWTHYPIRLNRKTRQVHVFRQDGTVLTAPWDELFLCIGSSKPPLAGEETDVRAHVLDEDGQTVRETHTLGYAYLRGQAATGCQWEFMRRYMEEPDFVGVAHEHVELANPVHDRREGFVFGVMRSFGIASKFPPLQIVMSPVLTLNALGRWIAMVTSKIPQWPADVEAACAIAADDPYRKDWRDNARLGFWDLWWPLICFVIGAIAVGWGVMWLVEKLA